MVTVVLTAAGIATAAAGLYLVVLAVAAFFLKRPPPTGVPTRRLAVLVPAHNEADLIGRCVASLMAQTYAPALFRVVVIADNCTDETAAIAASLGAEVLVREDADSRGKGQALRWAIDQIITAPGAPDAIVIVDADSLVDPGLLGALAARLDRGSDVVQGEYLALEEDGSAASTLRAAALLLFHRARFSGRAALGMPCNLVGNGMLFSRRLLEDQPWTAFSSAEDLEYSIDLRLAGFRPVYAPDATLRAPLPARGRAAGAQRLRWEGGRFHVVRTRLPRLVRAIFVQGRWSLLDAAVDLAVPPLGLLAMVAVAGTLASTGLAAWGLVPFLTVGPWLLASCCIPAFVVVGLAAARAPLAAYLSLALAPWFVASSLVTRLRLIRGLRATTWERTRRPSDDAPCDR